jgi:predicted transposase YdaD
MATDDTPRYNLIDIAVKRLVRDNPAAFLPMVGFQTAPYRVRFEDTAIQQRERRADQTCILTDETGEVSGVVYLEYQLKPEADKLIEWVSKWAELLQRFKAPVAMLVIYLERGQYATFPADLRSRLPAPLSSLETVVTFNTVRLWEFADQIRSGEYIDFVPLLPLCEEAPDEATVREQVALIRSSDLDEARKEELLSLSVLVASRDVARSILLGIIEEVFAMEVLPPIVEDMFGKALREREQQSRKEGEEIGRKEGEEIGALKDARAIVVRLYAKRLGAPSAEIIRRLEAIEAIEALHALIDRYDDQIESWEQLLPPLP